MASSTTQLERIAALVDKLEPVASKQRGMRIEADEWNTLVDVLLGVLQLDRLQEQRTESSLEQRFATREHEHLGKVSLDWLDPDLQARLGGSDSSIATRQLLAEMDQKIKSLSDQVSRLSNALNNHQRVIDDTIVQNIDRGRKLLTFEERFKGIEDLRTTVTTLSNDVGSVRGNVDKVLQFRSSLQDEAGNPIDVAQVKRDLTDLQSIRDNLKGADGKPLRLLDLEVKISEVADVVGTGGPGGLEGRFATFSASLQDTLATRNEATIKEVRTALLAENAAVETRLRGEIQTSATQLRDATAQQFATHVGNVTTSLNTFDSRLTTLKESATRDAVESTRALLNQRLLEVPDQVKTQLDTAVGTLRNTLTTNLQASLGATLTAQLKDADTRLSQQISAVQTSTTALREALPGVIAAQLDNALPTLQTNLNKFTTAELNTTRTAIESGLDARVSTALSASLQNLDARINAAVTQETSSIDGKVANAVSAATKNVSSQVADEVKLQIAGANLDAKLQDNARTITTQLRAELKSSLAEQDVKTSSAIQSSVTLLQGQVAAATAAALKDAKDFTAAQNTGLRTEFTTLVDTRVKTTRDAVLQTLDTRLKASHDQITSEVNAQVDNQIKAVNERVNTRFTNFERIGRIT